MKRMTLIPVVVAASCFLGCVAPRTAMYDPDQVWRRTERPIARALSGSPQDATREAQALIEGRIVKGAETTACIDVTSEMVQIIKDLIAQGAIGLLYTSPPKAVRGRLVHP